MGRSTARAVALALGCAVPAAAQEPAAPAPTIQSVVFEGAASLDEDVLEAAVATQPSSCRSPLFFVACVIGDFDWAEGRQLLTDTAEVSLDAQRLEALYRLWGYPEAVVRAEMGTCVRGPYRSAASTRRGFRSARCCAQERGPAAGRRC